VGHKLGHKTRRVNGETLTFGLQAEIQDWNKALEDRKEVDVDYQRSIFIFH
jgi:hypothetical protein